MIAMALFSVENGREVDSDGCEIDESNCGGDEGGSRARCALAFLVSREEGILLIRPNPLSHPMLSNW